MCCIYCHLVGARYATTNQVHNLAIDILAFFMVQYNDIDNISHKQRERACALDIVEFTSVRVIEAEDSAEAMWAYIRKYESDFASYSSGTIHAR